MRTAFEDVRVEQIAGEVTIDARHGAVEVSEVGAALTLESRHGDVEVRGVEGPSDLDVQHGKLAVRETAAVSARVARMDRVLKGRFGQLGLLVAFETMKRLQEAGDDEAALDATLYAYWLARDGGEPAREVGQEIADGDSGCAVDVGRLVVGEPEIEVCEQIGHVDAVIEVEVARADRLDAEAGEVWGKEGLVPSSRVSSSSRALLVVRKPEIRRRKRRESLG